MLRRHFATSAALILSLAIAGCGALETKKIDYKSATKSEPLEVPPDLTAPTTSDRYAVPDTVGRGSATLSTYEAERGVRSAAPSATTREVLPAGAGMHVERAGSQRWLVVAGHPDDLWPKIRNFWIELGFVLAVDAPQIGVMETDWAEDRAKLPQDIIRRSIGRVFEGLYSTPERDKFRTRMETGDESGTVEVFISHRGMVEIYPNEAKDSTIWQPRPADPELEAEMLRRLMVHLGAEDARAEAQLAVEAQPERARLATAGGATTLSVDDTFDRAWRRVGLALDRIGFTVQDRNRSEGVYYVRYIDPQADNATKKDEGILSKLAFWRSDEKVAEGGSEYRIHITGNGDETSRVRVLTREGGEDTSETAGRILGLLYNQLK